MLHTKLTKGSCPEYIKSSYTSIRKRQFNRKMDRRPKQEIFERRYPGGVQLY